MALRGLTRTFVDVDAGYYKLAVCQWQAKALADAFHAPFDLTRAARCAVKRSDGV